MSNLTKTQELLLEKMQKIDKNILDEDRALVHLNKQVGHKMQKLSELKAERRKLSSAYQEFITDASKNTPVIGLTMTDIK